MALMIILVLGSGFLGALPILAQEYLDPYYETDEYDYSSQRPKNENYECLKGPLEGIVVGSVEFCTKEFPAGPAGPQGPAGPAGAASTVPGPAGPQGPASKLVLNQVRKA